MEVRKISRLFKIWLMLASRSVQVQLLTTWSGVLFLIGKVVRFVLFFVFLFSILSASGNLGSYSQEQVIFFFLVFNLVDIMTQCLFRGVYNFRPIVVSGDYDLDLLKPLPSFFRPIFGWTDILDLLTLFPFGVYFSWFVLVHQLSPSLISAIFFLLLLANSLVIAFAFHLFVCSVCLLTTEIDHLIWVYRDLTNMARFPTDIYQKGVQVVLTLTIPVVILITVPTKALMGILSWEWVLFSFAMGGIFLILSLKFWRYALKQYSSASS